MRHRGGQAVVLLLLASVVAAGAAFPGLYVRATEQAIVALDVRQNPPDVTGLRITSRGHMITTYASPDDTPPAPPAALLALVPHPRQHGFGRPVEVSSAFPTAYPDRSGAGIGNLTSFSGMCAHVRFTEGRCPTTRNEIAVTAPDLRHFHLRLGGSTRVSTVPVNTVAPPGRASPRPHPVALRIVGVYEQVPSRYWFGTILTGRSGSIDQSKDIPHVAHDDWLTVPQTLAAGVPAPFPERYDEAWLPLDPRSVDLDTFESLGPVVHRVDRETLTPPTGVTISTVTGLPALLADLHEQQHQARVIVPLVVVQLVLLALFVLWLVIGAMTGQRRPEVALALLRGRGRRGARRQLSAELLPVALAGVPIGGAVAVIVASVVRRVALPPGAPLEFPASFWWSLAAAAAVLVVLVTASVAQVTREPVEALLRRVPPRSSHRLGATEVLLLAISGTAAVAFLTGGLRGAAALCGPAVLALLVGLLLARAVPVCAVLGRRALRRGRVGPGLVLLDAARNPAARRTVAVVAVASALLVFASDAFAVGERNRQLQAEQDVGAAAVLSVDTTDLAGVRAAVRHADPTGRRATPVVVVSPVGSIGPTTVAVIPDELRHVTSAPGVVQGLPLRRLRPPPGAPLRLTGTHLAVSVRTDALDVGGLGPGTRPHLVLGVVFAPGDPGSLDLGPLPPRGRVGRLHTTMSCSGGCLVTSVGVSGAPGAKVVVRLRLGAVRTDRGTVPWGPAGSWSPVSGPDGSARAVAAAGDGGLVVEADTNQSDEVDLPQQWFPTSVPALVTGALPPASTGDRFALTGLDGQGRPAVRVGRIGRVPGTPIDTALVDLETVARGSGINPGDRVQVWLASTGQGVLPRVRAALRARHLSVVSTATVTSQRTVYDRSASAWGLALGRVVGVLALLLAVLALLVVAATTWRPRSRDLAALAMAGVPRPVLRGVVTGGQLLVVVPAVAVGTATGIVGASVALDSMPLFTAPPAVPVLDLSTAWPSALAAGLVASAVLGCVGLLTGRAVARRGDLDRLREM